MDLMENLFNTYAISAVLGILVLYFIYRFATKNHTFWEERNVPYVKPLPFIGSLKDNFQNNVEDLDLERYRTLGKIYGFYEATKPCLMVAEPELLRDILVKDFPTFTNRRYMDMGDDVLNKMMTALQSEDWKRVRAIVSPTFSTGKLKRVLSIFQDCAKTLIQSFSKSAETNSPVDVLKFYGAYTMDIIASSAFSTKIDSHNDPDNIFIQKARTIFNQDMGFSILLFFLFPSVMKRIGFSLFPKDTMQFFKMTTLEIIKERKKTGQKRNDFLQLLMDSADEIDREEEIENGSEDIIQNYGDESNNNLVFKNVSTKSLGMNELIAQCALFFIAGYHTTALTLGFTTYHLALEQHVQDKLFHEIEDVLSQTNGVLSYESIQKMKYLDNVISETLRLHPPLTRLDRTADVEYNLKDTGITIPKGTLINIPVYAMHYDPKLFPEPERYNPERFSSGERDKIVPYSYLPFGAGPRNCVGMRFALLEIKICLAYVISTFHVEACSETKGKVTYEAIQNMKYLDNVMSEALRLHPPVIRLDRVAVEDYELKGTGISIPKGTTIATPVYALHRDPEFFPDPETFNPDRFSPENKDKIVPYSYLPFGAGPRNCIGMRFALLESKICLAHVLSTFQVLTGPETKIPLIHDKGGLGFLRPKDITLRFRQRDDCPLKR